MTNTEYSKILKEKEDELAEQVGRFQAKRMIGIFNGEIGSNTFLKLFELGMKLGREQKQ